jgi:hypothetical protein
MICESVEFELSSIALESLDRTDSKLSTDDSIWKPLVHSVQDWPLAIADGSTVESSDLVPTDSIRASSVESSMYSKFSERHRWFYLGNQNPDEVLLFKQFDTDENVKAARTYESSQDSVVLDRLIDRSILALGF